MNAFCAWGGMTRPKHVTSSIADNSLPTIQANNLEQLAVFGSDLAAFGCNLPCWHTCTASLSTSEHLAHKIQDLPSHHYQKLSWKGLIAIA